MQRILHIVIAAAFTGTLCVLPLSGANAAPLTQSFVAFEDEDFALSFSPVPDLDLSESRGAFVPDLLNLNNSNLNANNSNNTTVGGVTGNNFINDGSFTNSQGLVSVIQNSGNNVIIQSSTIVNMTMIGN
jgi:hypothetical protein